MALTPTQALAGHLLGEPVHTWITARRAEGKTWRLISRELYEATDHTIDVTYEALRKWAATPPAEQVTDLTERTAS